MNYGLSAHDKSEVNWKVTGNLGGEQYRDLVQRPLNEGAMYAESQGHHYPEPPSLHWEAASLIKDGVQKKRRLDFSQPLLVFECRWGGIFP